MQDDEIRNHGAATGDEPDGTEGDRLAARWGRDESELEGDGPEGGSCNGTFGRPDGERSEPEPGDTGRRETIGRGEVGWHCVFCHTHFKVPMDSVAGGCPECGMLTSVSDMAHALTCVATEVREGGIQIVGERWKGHPSGVILPNHPQFNSKVEMKGPYEAVWVSQNWSRLEHHFQRLVDEQPGHGMTVQGIAGRIKSGALRVWVLGNFRAVFCTAIAPRDDGKLVCSLSWGVGQDVVSKDVLAANLPVIEDYARLNGCHSFEVNGRKGWERALRDFGYTELYRALQKDL